METVLVWCVVGPTGSSCKRDDVIRWNRTAVQDAGTKHISWHHFEIQKEVKETEISEMMERMYQLDLTEPRAKFKELIINRSAQILY